MRKVFVKRRERREGQYMFFMHQFVEACIEYGIKAKSECHLYERTHLRGILYRLLLPIYWIITKIFPFFLGRKKAIIVTSNGRMILWDAFPYYFNHEIILMLWDVWPQTWNTLYRDIKLLRCKTVLISVRSMAEQLHRDLGVTAYWIPEGINTKEYFHGNDLAERPHDIYEMGRRYEEFHKVVEQLKREGVISESLDCQLDEHGCIVDDKRTFKTAEELQRALPTYKIIPCFPRIDTNPEMAGDLETLTQRYWEAMLSRCLIVGRAPQELIDVLGYNPVIDIDWTKPGDQLRDILNNISSYQSIVDKNYKNSIKIASWTTRIEMIDKLLQKDGYYLK